MWNRPPRKSPDEERGVAQPLYPAMVESPELRWGLIRKIYSILTVQILLTVAVASFVVFVPPVTTFFVTTTPGLVLYIFLIIFPFIGSSLFPLVKFIFVGSFLNLVVSP